MNLGNKIRELRRAKNMTQEQLAFTLNISPQAVSKWEIGASYPDMTLVPVLAGLFGVSLDELFDYNVKNIDKEIEDIRLESGKYFWGSFEKAERILLDGIERYPASILLKTELCELYAYNISKGDEIVNRAFELAGQIIAGSQDIFCTCRTKHNMILIYKKLEKTKNENHYDEIKALIDGLPYMYPYMLQDKMRLSACYIKGEEGMKEAFDLRDIEWQELFSSCHLIGKRYFDMEDYENAMKHCIESVDVIERFMDHDKPGCSAYPIDGTQSNHAITLLDIAACMHRLNKTEGIDEILEKSKRIYFDAYEHEFDEIYDYRKMMNEMIEYYTGEYNRLKLNEYRILDLSDIERRIDERTQNNQ